MHDYKKHPFIAVFDTGITTAYAVPRLNPESPPGAWRAPHFRSPIYSTATCWALVKLRIFQHWMAVLTRWPIRHKAIIR
jgi:hypothetical protein